MNFIIKPFLFCFLLTGLFISSAGAQSTIFLVRHAEKEDAGNDPDLSEAGRARAESLAKLLKDAGITAIYVTEFNRTQQTAQPMAKALGLNVTIVPAKETSALSARLHDPTGNVLVVGHGNTIPDLIKALGLAAPVNIGESDYDNLYLITLGQKPRLLQLHYR
jgi:broad specificity phosphatase PhoE